MSLITWKQYSANGDSAYSEIIDGYLGKARLFRVTRSRSHLMPVLYSYMPSIFCGRYDDVEACKEAAESSIKDWLSKAGLVVAAPKNHHGSEIVGGDS